MKSDLKGLQKCTIRGNNVISERLAEQEQIKYNFHLKISVNKSCKTASVIGD